MGAFFKCDFCGTEVPGTDMGDESYTKPQTWFRREFQGKTEFVCSMDCAQKLNDKTDTQSLILQDDKGQKP